MEWGGNNNSDEDFFMNNGLKMIAISVPWCTDSVAHPPPLLPLPCTLPTYRFW